MTDITKQKLPSLISHRIPGLEMAEECLVPHYSGHSILNLPASICHWLDIPSFGKPALFPEVLSVIGAPVRRVIFILMDALGLQRFQNALDNKQAPVWEKLLAKGGLLAPLTSITPSTTSAALTSLWTGASPAEHGVVGYELWLKEYGVVTNMILHAPISFRNDTGSLSRAGFQPEKFLDQPLFGAHLKAHGIQPYAFQHASILRSGLSQMLMGQEVDGRGFSTASDLWINLRQLIQEKPQERQYIWVYWSEVDHFSHLYGPGDERPAAEFSAFSQSFEQLLLQRLDASLRSETLIILTADHGQITTRKTPHFDLRNHPNLARRLHILPTGENRFMYLFLRPGQGEAVREYFERSWPRQFGFIDPEAAVQAGLFGPGTPHPQILDRLGDALVYARGDGYLWWANKDNPLVGRHGGFSAEEMLVPFLVTRL
jgi:hypothetical protein